MSTNHPRSLLSPLSVVCLAAMLAGCSAGPSERSSSARQSAADSVSDDENLQYFKDNGFGAILFAQTCVSKADDGSVVGGDALPVGAGRWLECATARKVTHGTMEIMSSADVPWCVLGVVRTYKGKGDPRLQVEIAATPSDGFWTFKATHEGDSISITRIDAGFGGTAWPLWIDAAYETQDMKPAPASASCDDAFGP